jgi:2-isopropylmalate synthase
MWQNPAEKYRPFPAVRLTGRKWPSRAIDHAPVWMSTDLRDGNQALIEPMNAEQKLEFFEMLVAIGFKEIEVGYPSASQTDFEFVRKLIEENRIPDDVTIEVFMPSRAELIARTFEALEGAPRAIVHLYNAICPSFRRIVFNKSKAEIKALAVQGTQIIKDHAQARPGTHWTFQYSPETFNAAELPFAREVCDAVAQTWRPTRDHKMIVTRSNGWTAISAIATASCCRCIRITIAAPRWPPRNWRCWPARIASRAACSAMASAPATSISSRWR